MKRNEAVPIAMITEDHVINLIEAIGKAVNLMAEKYNQERESVSVYLPLLLRSFIQGHRNWSGEGDATTFYGAKIIEGYERDVVIIVNTNNSYRHNNPTLAVQKNEEGQWIVTERHLQQKQ